MGKSSQSGLCDVSTWKCSAFILAVDQESYPHGKTLPSIMEKYSLKLIHNGQYPIIDALNSHTGSCLGLP